MLAVWMLLGGTRRCSSTTTQPSSTAFSRPWRGRTPRSSPSGSASVGRGVGSSRTLTEVVLMEASHAVEGAEDAIAERAGADPLGRRREGSAALGTGPGPARLRDPPLLVLAHSRSLGSDAV